MVFEQFTIPYLHGMFEQLLSMLFDYMGFIDNLFMIVASWFLLQGLVASFSMIVVWMFSYDWLFQICYALWLFVDAKGGEKWD